MPEAGESSLMPVTPAVSRLRSRVVADGSSIGLMLLATFAFLLIGRAPEIFVALLPLRLLLVTGVLVIAWAVTVPRKPFPDFWNEPEVRLPGYLLVYATATMPFSIWPSESLEFVTGFVKLVVFVTVMVHCVRSRRHLTVMVWAVLAAALLLQFAILAGYGGLNAQTVTLSSTQGDRAWVTGTYDPNDIAFVMACVLPLAFFRAVSSRGMTRYVAGLIAFLCIVTTVRTESRGGFVTIVVVGSVLFAKSRPRVRWMLTGLGVVAMLGFASGTYWDRIGTIWGQTSPELSSYDAAGLDVARWQTWKNMIALALDYLPFGSGAGTVMTAEGVTHGPGVKWETAHNAFLQIFVEMGLPGIVIFVALLYGAISSCRRLARTASGRAELNEMAWMAHGVETSLYAYILGAFALSQAYAAILYLLLGLTACLRRIAYRRLSSA